MIPLSDENPVRIVPFVTYFLVGLNIFVFIIQLSHGVEFQGFTLSLGAVPYEITHFKQIKHHPVPVPLTLLTLLFVHGGIAHIAGNMLYLWIFGNNVEEAMGHLKFTAFYLLSGFVASFAHILFNPYSKMPTVGASGAIAGVLGAYIVLYPKARIKTLIFLFIFIQIVSIPAVFFLGFWFLMQMMFATSGGGVAWFAHIGGFVFGLALVKVFETGQERLGKTDIWKEG